MEENWYKYKKYKKLYKKQKRGGSDRDMPRNSAASAAAAAAWRRRSKETRKRELMRYVPDEMSGPDALRLGEMTINPRLRERSQLPSRSTSRDGNTDQDPSDPPT